MRNLTIEVYVNLTQNEMKIFRSEPAYGESHEPAKGGTQYGILNDGHNRVKFGVFNATLPLSLIKATARMALTAEAEGW